MTKHFVQSDDVAAIRSRIDHPVVDADGHQIEFVPLLSDYVRTIAGQDVARRFDEGVRRTGRVPLGTGREGFAPVRVFFTSPARNSLDRVTATVPALLYDRLDELGLDFILLYPTLGLGLLAQPNAEIRQAVAAALNTYNAEQFAPYRDRIEPVAVIPTFTPEEAVAALDHAVGTLGLKAVVMSGVIPRDQRPDGTAMNWVDTLGHGSVHSYDILWRRCVELGVTPTFHGSAKGWGTHNSSTNYVFNHLGGFATAQEAVCRSLFIGGVPRRFPELRFSFLEGGVAWALQLYLDVLGHFGKRNREAVRQFDPSLVDVDECSALFERFATGGMGGLSTRFADDLREAARRTRKDVGSIDDFADSLVTSAAEIVETFTTRFAFGCEADDPLNALSVDKRLLPNGAPLQAMFGSDIGHWDATDMRNVLPEAFELVENGLLTEREFREFTYGNVVSTMCATNPSFFKGTVVEDAAGMVRS